MPQQELFFEERTGNRRVEVFKIYDRVFALEAFTAMDQAARSHLWNWLEIDQIHEPNEVPGRDTAAGEDFLWEELLDAAREDGNLLSFFVVSETVDGRSESLYVSPDWPSAEAFAKRRMMSVI